MASPAWGTLLGGAGWRWRTSTTTLLSKFVFFQVVGSIGSLVFLFSLCFATFIEALQTIFHNDHLDTMHHAHWIMIAMGGQVGLCQGVEFQSVSCRCSECLVR